MRLVRFQPEVATSNGPFGRFHCYNSAWSDLFKQYVEIKRVYADRLGEMIIEARIAFTNNFHLFREEELSEFM